MVCLGSSYLKELELSGGTLAPRNCNPRVSTVLVKLFGAF